MYIGDDWDESGQVPVAQQSAAPLHVVVEQQVEQQEDDAVHRHLGREHHGVARPGSVDRALGEGGRQTG